MKVLRGKKALVTGAASGIGRSIALALAREGVDLYLVDIDDLKIDGVMREARSHGIEVRTARCDLARAWRHREDAAGRFACESIPVCQYGISIDGVGGGNPPVRKSVRQPGRRCP